MLFTTLGLVGLVGAAAVDLQHRDAGTSIFGRCGTTSAPQAAVNHNMRREQPKTPDNTSVILPVEVYMHVISADSTEEGGNLSDERIEAQIDVLNEAFKPVGYSFHVVETERIINEQWYYNLRQESTVETEVVTLRKGSNATLNIYTHGTLNDPSMAWATLPMSVDRVQYDGVFQNATTWLGGGVPERDEGDTLVHEVGHWFGLYHTFSPGCEFSWDYVDDTPFEDDALVLGGCPIGQDSCPDKPGLDSIHNYMAYTSDECRYEFTPGQIQRMREQVARYRRIVYPGIDPDNVPDTGA